MWKWIRNKFKKLHGFWQVLSPGLLIHRARCVGVSFFSSFVKHRSSSFSFCIATRYTINLYIYSTGISATVFNLSCCLSSIRKIFAVNNLLRPLLNFLCFWFPLLIEHYFPCIVFLLLFRIRSSSGAVIGIFNYDFWKS